jgi:hypothetical protein
MKNELFPRAGMNLNKPPLVAGFTIIDHRQFKGKNDKVYQNTKRVLVAKPQSVELLNKHAMKRGGLAGTTWDVSRIGDSNSAAIGTLFDFVDKKPIPELEALYMKEFTDPKTNVKTMKTYFTPADWEKELTYKTGDELRIMGFGKQTSSGGVGSTSAPVVDPATNKPIDYSHEL